MNVEPNGLAQKIRSHRRRSGESQENFGKRFGVRRLTVINWEKGVRPSSRHLPQVIEELNAEEDVRSEELTYQLLLPFDQPIHLDLKVLPQTADTIHFEVRLKRNAS
jgi:DNA-binding XRE family transcriptional regulator